MSDSPKIMFILSLPRSGSTLLQKMMAAATGAATTSETWFLLPVYGLEKKGLYAEYQQRGAVLAIEELIAKTGHKAFARKRAEFIRGVFGLLCQEAGQDTFIEKTPRNALYAEEMLEDFPSDDFIVLWRNPLDIISSIISTWGHGRWNVHAHKVDLFKCLENLIALVQRHPDRVVVVNYEQLVRDPDAVLAKLGTQLGRQMVPDMTARTMPTLDGFMGDKKGEANGGEVTDRSIGAWKQVLCNPLRVRWARQYLAWIGIERLGLMGYDYNELVGELAAQPVSSRYLLRDLVAMLYGFAYVTIDFTILRDKIRKPWRHVVNNG